MCICQNNPHFPEDSSESRAVLMAPVFVMVGTQSSGDWLTSPTSAFERHLFTGFFWVMGGNGMWGMGEGDGGVRGKIVLMTQRGGWGVGGKIVRINS